MDNIPAILKVDSGGMPVSWIHWHTAVTLYARELVRWEAGDERFLILGGTNARTGLRSSCRIGSSIAVADRSRRPGPGVPLLTNRTLFPRDPNLSLYCCRQFSPHLPIGNAALRETGVHYVLPHGAPES